jgi:hypothetical protein
MVHVNQNQRGQFTEWSSEDVPGLEIQYSPVSGHYYLQLYNCEGGDIDYEQLLVEQCPSRKCLVELREFLTAVLESKTPTYQEILDTSKQEDE